MAECNKNGLDCCFISIPVIKPGKLKFIANNIAMQKLIIVVV